MYNLWFMDANRPNCIPTCFYLSKEEAQRFLDDSRQQVPQGISRTEYNKWMIFRMISIPSFAWYIENWCNPLGSSIPTNWLKTIKLMRLDALTVNSNRVLVVTWRWCPMMRKSFGDDTYFFGNRTQPSRLVVVQAPREAEWDEDQGKLWHEGIRLWHNAGCTRYYHQQM